jgi:hypothetical protein
LRLRPCFFTGELLVFVRFHLFRFYFLIIHFFLGIGSCGFVLAAKIASLKNGLKKGGYGGFWQTLWLSKNGFGT